MSVGLLYASSGPVTVTGMGTSKGGGDSLVAVEVLMTHHGVLSSALGVLALTARLPPTNSCRKYQPSDLTSGTSAVHIALGPFFQPVIFRPPLKITSSPGLAA